MRDALDAYVDMHELQAPVPARKAIPSPFFSYGSFSRIGTSVLAFAVLLLVGGTGAAYAAEGSVPGNTLYPVKVSVIEPLQGALITSAKGQATWHANLASRRLEEATKLAVADKLDPSTQEYLQAKFNTEVTKSSEDADTLVATGNTDAALDVRSDLEARITAHAQILAVISNHLEETASSTDAAENSTLTGTKLLLAAVEQRHNEVTEARIALEDSTNADSGSAVAIETFAKAEVRTQGVDAEAKIAGDANVAPVAAHITAARTMLAKTRQPENAAESSNDSHAAERSSEVASILLQHASLLRAYAPIATTSTSTMATSTTMTAATTTGKDSLPQE
jgi:hypothetical protein